MMDGGDSNIASHRIANKCVIKKWVKQIKSLCKHGGLSSCTRYETYFMLPKLWWISSLTHSSCRSDIM